MTGAATPALRVGALFSARTDLVRALADLAAQDPAVALVAAASDRGHDPSTVPRTVTVREFPTADHGDRVRRDLAMADWLASHRVQLVVCAGWLWLLSPRFLDQFPNRVLNVHPTLLPAFPGRHSVEAAAAYGVHVHGVTIHLVDAGVDTGPILIQAARHFPKPETASRIRAALAPVERHELCEAVAAFAHGRVRHDGATGRWAVAPRLGLAEP